MKYIALLLISSVLACADNKVVLSPGQENGPNNDEILVEYKLMPENEARGILNDIRTQITWNWSRISRVEGGYVLLGEVTKNGQEIMGTLYELAKFEGKWMIVRKGLRIKSVP